MSDAACGVRQTFTTAQAHAASRTSCISARTPAEGTGPARPPTAPPTISSPSPRAYGKRRRSPEVAAEYNQAPTASTIRTSAGPTLPGPRGTVTGNATTAAAVIATGSLG